MASIIVGTDLSSNALTAARWAFGLAQLLDSVRVEFVQVIPTDEFELRQTISGNDSQAEIDETRDEILQWLDDVETGDTRVDAKVLIGRRANKLRQYARATEADWLVAGKSGRGRLSRFFLGSTAANLALDPPCPLVLVHPDTDQWSEPLRVLSATDLDESSAHGAQLGAELARLHGGMQTVLHVISLPQGTPPIVSGPASLPETLNSYLGQSTNWARREMDSLVESRDLPVDEVEIELDIRPGYPIHEILDVAEELGANLLTLGSHKRSKIADLMVGNIGKNLVKRASSTILVAPATPD